jgi:hypothetical protein
MAGSRKRSSKQPARLRAGSKKKAAQLKSAASPAFDRSLRQHVVNLLRGGSAHATFDAIVADLPAAAQGSKPAGAPHTPWQLLEHLRIAQWDILEFSRNPRHVSPRFPEGYWPASAGPPDAQAWENSLKAFHDDLKQMIELVTRPANDLFARIPHGDGQTILREAILVADHNAYHLGQLVLLRRLLGAWPQD